MKRSERTQAVAHDARDEPALLVRGLGGEQRSEGNAFDGVVSEEGAFALHPLVKRHERVLMGEACRDLAVNLRDAQPLIDLTDDEEVTSPVAFSGGIHVAHGRRS